jgi:hypothetical protein
VGFFFLINHAIIILYPLMLSMKNSVFALSFLLLVLCGTALQGEIALSKIGTEIRGIRTASSLGLLFGWRYMHHRSETFSIGGAAYTGQISEGNTGSFSYGGLETAFSTDLTQALGIELSLLAGGAGGFTSAGSVAGGIVLEPSLSFSFNFGKTVRTCLSVGYAWLANHPNFSGYTVGLRFDFLSGIEELSRS